MRSTVQLRISAPCSQEWNELRPEERGRYCASCRKMVVDFTGMNDQEVLQYMSRATTSVCGRLSANQLEGQLLVPDGSVIRNGKPARLWAFLLAGLLITGRVSAQSRPLRRAGVREISIIRPEPPAVAESIPVVTIAAPAPYQSPALIGPLGGVFIHIGGVSTGTRIRPADTISWVQEVVDTFSFFSLLPKKELLVYPNPVRRGNPLQLAWKIDAGNYTASFFNLNGQLLQTRQILVSGSQQVDLWEVPAEWTPGTYLLRVMREDGKTAYSRKIVVR